MAQFTPFEFQPAKRLAEFCNQAPELQPRFSIYALTVCPFVLGLIGLICSCVDFKGIIQLKQAVVGRGFSHQTLCRPSSTQKQNDFTVFLTIWWLKRAAAQPLLLASCCGMSQIVGNQYFHNLRIPDKNKIFKWLSQALLRPVWLPVSQCSIQNGLFGTSHQLMRFHNDILDNTESRIFAKIN